MKSEYGFSVLMVLLFSTLISNSITAQTTQLVNGNIYNSKGGMMLAMPVRRASTLNWSPL